MYVCVCVRACVWEVNPSIITNTSLGFPAHLEFLRTSTWTLKSISIQLLDSEVCKTHAKVPREEKKVWAVA